MKSRPFPHSMCRLPAALLAFVCLLLLASGPFARAQGDEVHVAPRTPPAAPAPPEAAGDPSLKTHTKPIKVQVNLVLIPVTVTDPMNRLVTGLDRQHFAIFENSKYEPIKTFSSEDAPTSVGVIFDMSGSMSNKILKARDAIVEFMKTANPQDEFFVITFNERPELLADFTSSVEEIEAKLVTGTPKGRTALLDAIYLGMNKMKNAKYDRRALLIISDGGDNRSRYTEGEIKSMVKEADVQVYSIGVFEDTPPTLEERNGPFLLNEISELTGGRLFRVENPNELPDIASKIGAELRNQYVIGYRPTNAARDGKWRKLKVKLMPPKGLPPLTVHARTGYYAPTE